MQASFLKKWYGNKLNLWLDMPQLLEAYEIWCNGQYQQPSAYEMKALAGPGFEGPVVVAGQSLLLEFISQWHFPENDIIYLGSLRKETGKPYVDEGFLNYLQRFSFLCNIDTVAEGTVVWPGNTILKIEGPLIQVVLIRHLLSGLLAYTSWLTTFAAGWAGPANGASGTTGPEDMLMLSRAYFLAGNKPTSNILAGRILGIPVNIDEPPLQTPSLPCPFAWHLEPATTAFEAMPLTRGGQILAPSPSLQTIGAYCQNEIKNARG